MWKNYLTIAIRNLLKHKAFTLIHVIGLSVGLVSALLILYYVQFERSYEAMHEKADNIFRLSLDIYNGDEFVDNDTETYQTLGPDLKEKMPEVLEYVRFSNAKAAEVKTLSNDIKGYESGIYFTDPSVFNVFSCKLLYHSNIKRFEEPFTLVISERMALKYFGKPDVIGESLKLVSDEKPMEIVGVMEDMPQNTHLKFDFLISHATLPVIYAWYNENTWNLASEYTYLLMREGVQVEDFNQKLALYSKENEQITNEILLSEKIADIHLYSNKTYEPEVNGSAQTVNFMGMIGIFVMLLAWINYINLSTAKAMERAKEVGIRKAVGSSKKQLISQFYCEAFLVNLLACIVAVLLFQLVLPYFKDFTGQDLSIGQFGVPKLILFLAGMVIGGTLISGFYPAIILSGFEPMLVLKGRFSNSAKGKWLRQGLVFFQFTATVVLVCVSLAVYFQMSFLTQIDLGVDIDNTLVIRAPQTTDSVAVNAHAFQSLLRANSQVAGITKAKAVPGGGFQDMGAYTGVRRLGENESEGGFTYYNYAVQYNYIDVMGIKMLVGNNFEANSAPEKVLLNEMALKKLGFKNGEEAIGEKITFFHTDEPAEILGVFKDFYQRSPKEKHIPIILYRNESLGNFIVKLNTRDTREALNQVTASWNQVYPNHTLDYYFLNDQYNHQYHADQQFGKTVALLTILSLLIAGLGLFGLSSYMVALRTKEMGVRKVLGAPLQSIIGLLSKDYLIMVGFSGMVAIPVAYFLIQKWLENYALQFSLSWWLFALPLGFVLLATLLTIGVQTITAATENPVQSLRSE